MYEVQVFVIEFDKQGKRKELYRNVIKLNDSISFPFDSVYRTMALLYPHALVQFQIAT